MASRANAMESTRHTFEEIKEYSDSATQYDPTLFAVNHGMQTEPERKIVTATFSIQTDPIPEPKPLPAPPPIHPSNTAPPCLVTSSIYTGAITFFW